jgi:hypothetical protein
MLTSNLHWRILRAPWGQPRGSERDSAKESAFNLLLLHDSAGKAARLGADCTLTILTKPRSDIWPLMRMFAVGATALGFFRRSQPKRVDERPGNRLKCPRKRRAILTFGTITQ